MSNFLGEKHLKIWAGWHVRENTDEREAGSVCSGIMEVRWWSPEIKWRTIRLRLINKNTKTSVFPFMKVKVGFIIQSYLRCWGGMEVTHCYGSSFDTITRVYVWIYCVKDWKRVESNNVQLIYPTCGLVKDDQDRINAFLCKEGNNQD